MDYSSPQNDLVTVENSKDVTHEMFNERGTFVNELKLNHLLPALVPIPPVLASRLFLITLHSPTFFNGIPLPLRQPYHILIIYLGLPAKGFSLLFYPFHW